MPDKKLTDAEIVKALECCGGITDGVKECSVCPLLEKSPCTTDLSRNTLDLINRQKAEIDGLQKDGETLAIALLKAKAEIERLKKFLNMSRKVSLARRDQNIRKDELMIKMSAECKTAKAEAIKEVAERYERCLLSQLTTAPLDKKEWINFCLDELDNLKKEMVGDSE